VAAGETRQRTEAVNFRERLLEVLEYPADVVTAEAESFLESAQNWNHNTQVPLWRLAFVIAALVQVQDPNVRRVMLTDALKVGDGLG
jgi:hypothetical protein